MVLVGVCQNFYAGGPLERHLHRVKVALYFFWKKEEKRKESCYAALQEKNVAVLVHFGGKWAVMGVPWDAARVQGAKSHRNRSNRGSGLGLELLVWG